MSNVIEFKKRPAPVESSDPCKAASYNLAELLDYEYTDTDIVDENGQLYAATPESHYQSIAYFDAFGFDYEKYSTRPFVLWHAFCGELAGCAKMCLIHNDTWNIVKRRRPADEIAYIEAVAAQDRESIMKYRHVGEDYYRQALARFIAERQSEGE
jgi:hypothetical protein